MQLFTETLGRGKTIILVHGWAMHSEVWRDFAEQLARYFQVILVDLPGHGRSEKLEHFTLKNISQALIKEIPMEPCCWLGWSLGTKIVLDISRQYPERVESLVLVAGNPCFTRTESWPGVDAEFLRIFKRSLENNGNAALQRFLLLQLQGTEQARLLAKNLKINFSRYKTPDISSLLAGLDILRHADLRPELASAHCPVSIILGETDHLVSKEAGEKMLEIQPDCELNIIKNAGHLPFLSHQAKIIKVLRDFVA
jgi:pimeloyl-[acyl-carrier protein] methyl ester esterase